MDRHTAVTIERRAPHEAREFALKQIYQQILERQPYQSEHQALEKLEKDFLKEKLGVRHFIKELAQSEPYLDSFYYTASNPKFIETCLKHFLGRAVQDNQEMHLYMDILMHQGVRKFVISIIDSEEYRKAFGCSTVPYIRSHSHHSPNGYVENQVLNNEHYGQRGRGVPMIYWHQLGLDCETGVCHYPEASPAASPETNAKTTPTAGNQSPTATPQAQPKRAQSAQNQAQNPTRNQAQKTAQAQPNPSKANPLKSANEMSLQELLEALDSPAGEETAATLSERQRAALRRLVS